MQNRTPIITQRGIDRSPPQDMYFKGALFLHTLRSVVNDDARWWRLMGAVFERFKYQNIMTEDLVSFINKELDRDLTSIFDQYLRHADIPTLELAFNEAEGTVSYRWKANERGFNMPIRVGLSGSCMEIQPSTEWKSTDLKRIGTGITQDEVQVATDLYYVNVVRY